MPTPEKSTHLPEDYEDVLNNLKFQKKNVPTSYETTSNEIRNMAKGGNADGVREEYYENWTDNNFKKLLEDLGEK